MGKGNKSQANAAKWIALLVIVCVIIIPAAYVGTDFMLVSLKIGDLPGGLFTLSSTTIPVIIPVGDKISVDRTIKISYVDQEGQSVLATRVLNVYNPDGSLYEVLTTTDSAGQATSTKSYVTGAHYWIYDTTSYQTQEIIIPAMARSTAEGTTAPNAIGVYGHTAETFTDLLAKGATTYADGDDLNYTAIPSGTLVYSWSGVTDDRACVSSPRDGTLKLNGQFFPENNVLFIVLSAGDYASAIINGMDGSYSSGSVVVYYKVLGDSAFTKDKDGNGYKPGLDGTGSVAIPFDFSGMSSATNTTFQVYILSDACQQYAAQYHASGATATFYGPHAVQLMEQTVTLYK